MSEKFFRRWAGNIRDNLDALSRFYRGQSVAFKKLDGVSSFGFQRGTGRNGRTEPSKRDASENTSGLRNGPKSRCPYSCCSGH